MGQTDDLKLSPQVSVYLLTENRLLRDTLARLLRKRSEINVVGVSRCSESDKNEIISSHCDVVLTDYFDDTARSTFLRDILEPRLGNQAASIRHERGPRPLFEGGLPGDLRLSPQGRFSRGDCRRGASCCPRRSHLSPEPLHDSDSTSAQKEQEKLETSDSQNSDRKALTPRQLQLIRLVASGLTNKEIAANLNLSQFTVKNHIRRVMRQMEAVSRHDAVNLIRATGQLAPP